MQLHYDWNDNLLYEGSTEQIDERDQHVAELVDNFDAWDPTERVIDLTNDSVSARLPAFSPFKKPKKHVNIKDHP